MPRTPKDPDVRQRRNKAATAAELSPPGSPELSKVKIPPLNAKQLGIKGGIKPQVREWWNDAWRSPMAPRWLKTDMHVLYLCALLRQQIAMFAIEGKPVATLAGELRQQERRVGLDVMARRSLDWRIEGPRQADATPAPQAAPPPMPEGADPRRLLRAVT
jgi:hypothetical protein